MKTTVLTKSQSFKKSQTYTENGDTYNIIVNIRYDDECGNGHNTFAITGNIYRQTKSGRWTDDVGGCIHDEIAKRFPEYAKYIKWHLTSSDEPMHYIANTLYHAGNRDCWGLKKGEFKQHTSRGKLQNNGVEEVPGWKLEIPKDIETDIYLNKKPEPVTIEWKPRGVTGEGKERDLDAARHTAIWLDATDEELTAPGLKQRLLDRHTALMTEFAHDIEELGLIY